MVLFSLNVPGLSVNEISQLAVIVPISVNATSESITRSTVRLFVSAYND